MHPGAVCRGFTVNIVWSINGMVIDEGKLKCLVKNVPSATVPTTHPTCSAPWYRNLDFAGRSLLLTARYGTASF